jgi:hypothetical protein
MGPEPETGGPAEQVGTALVGSRPKPGYFEADGAVSGRLPASIFPIPGGTVRGMWKRLNRAGS